jgi:hypothetical protein
MVDAARPKRRAALLPGKDVLLEFAPLILEN